MDRNAPMTIFELDLLNFIGFLRGPPRVKYTTVLEQNLQWVFARLYWKSYNKALKPIDFRTHLKNSSIAMVLSSTPVVDKYGAALREMRLAIQA